MTGRPEQPEHEHSGFVAPDDPWSARLQQLAHLTALLAAADSVDAVTSVVVHDVADVIQAAVATLMLTRDDRLVMVGAQGIQSGIEDRFAEFGLNDLNPASEAARERRPVILSAEAQIETRYPVLAGTVPAGRSLVCLPLLDDARPLGVVGLTFDESWTPKPRELDFLLTFADACAQALRRVEADARAAEQAAQLRFLADASLALAGDLDYAVTLSHVAELAVPILADWCTVAMERSGELVTVAVAHQDPSKVAWAWDLQTVYPPDLEAPTGAAQVIRTGRSQRLERITDEMLVAGARDAEHLRIARDLRLHSAMVVPLAARGRTFGALSFFRTAGGRTYSEADVDLAEDLGRRGGLAIDNAMLYGRAQDAALQLQRAVLPTDLAVTTGEQIATYYRPGGNAEVGGDFFDAVRLASGRVALFIGDVAGHGIQAAAAMAHTRAATRAYLSIDPDPVYVVSMLDQMFIKLDLDQLVTMVYAVYDPSAGQVEMVNAGHYPPLLASRAGATRYLSTTPQFPIGVSPAAVRTADVHRTGDGDTVLLYTDGLIERRGEVIDDGLTRLATAATSLQVTDLDHALATLVTGLSEASVDDDVTALALRVSTGSRGSGASGAG